MAPKLTKQNSKQKLIVVDLSDNPNTVDFGSTSRFALHCFFRGFFIWHDTSKLAKDANEITKCWLLKQFTNSHFYLFISSIIFAPLIKADYKLQRHLSWHQDIIVYKAEFPTYVLYFFVNTEYNSDYFNINSWGAAE